MALATGVAKKLAYKKESSWGVLAGQTGAQYLRRVTSDISLSRDPYQSQEIRSDYQLSDYRLGVRRVQGNINGQLSLGTYADFFAALLRSGWTTGVSLAASANTTITVSNSAKTITRGGTVPGSWISDGFKVGDLVRSINLDPAINGKNLRITALTATVMSVAENPGADVAAPNSTCTIKVQGKKLLVPQTGHTDDSFTIEHHFSDLSQSEVFTGCKVSQASIGLPATGISTCQFGIMGKDMSTFDSGTTPASPYFTTPNANSTGSVLAAVNGALRVGGTDLALVTSMQLNVAGGYTSEPVVGSNSVPAVFPGRVVVTGQMSAFFDAGTLRDAYLNESDLNINLVLNQDGTSTYNSSNSLVINLPKVRLSGGSKDDGEKGIVQSFQFQALLKGDGGSGTAYDATTISIQDTTL